MIVLWTRTPQHLLNMPRHYFCALCGAPLPEGSSRHHLAPTASRRGARLVLLALALGRLGADLLVVLLEGGQVLAGLGELALLHALADVLVDEGTLGVHEVELVVNARVELG